MRTVREVLQQKGKEVHTITPQDTVFDAVARMADHDVGALVVVHHEKGGDRVCGIISERDYLRHIVIKGRTSRDTPVQQIMTRKVIYGEPDCTMEEALNIMTAQRIRHLPIMEGGKLAGLVSIGDCVKETIRSQEVQIKVLKEYIADAYPGPCQSAD